MADEEDRDATGQRRGRTRDRGTAGDMAGRDAWVADAIGGTGRERSDATAEEAPPAGEDAGEVLVVELEPETADDGGASGPVGGIKGSGSSPRRARLGPEPLLGGAAVVLALALIVLVLWRGAAAPGGALLVGLFALLGLAALLTAAAVVRRTEAGQPSR